MSFLQSGLALWRKFWVTVRLGPVESFTEFSHSYYTFRVFLRGETADLRNLWYGFVGSEVKCEALGMEHDFYEVGAVGQNRIRWIFGRRGKIPESLAVIQPLLFFSGVAWGKSDVKR